MSLYETSANIVLCAVTITVHARLLTTADLASHPSMHPIQIVVVHGGAGSHSKQSEPEVKRAMRL